MYQEPDPTQQVPKPSAIPPPPPPSPSRQGH